MLTRFDPTALAGAVYQLSRIPAWQLVGKVENAGCAAAVCQSPLGGSVTSIPIANPDVGAMELIRALSGMPQR